MTPATRRTVLLCALLLPAWASLGERTGAADAERGILIGTAAVTGVYYQAGSAICRLVEQDNQRRTPPEPALACGTMMTGGSIQNVAALRAGNLDAALVQSDILAHAVDGTGPFSGRTNDRLRSLFSLHGEPYQLLVLRSLGIRSFDDLKGRKVDIGKNGSAANEAFRALMRRHGLTEASFAEVVKLDPADQITAFCDGDSEALGMLVGYPFASYRHAIEHCDGDLLVLDSDADHKMVADTPAYSPAVIPRRAYPSIDRDVTTFQAVAVAVATTDTPDAVVYRLVRDVFERLDDLRAMSPALATLDPRRMITVGITAPLHPGAVRYFKEKGLL